MFPKFSLRNKFQIKPDFVLNLLLSLIIFKTQKIYITMVKYIRQKLIHYEL